MSVNEKRNEADVVLEVDGIKFPCRREVLAKHSPYFHAMFTNNFLEKNQDVIKIQGVDATSMDFLLHWMDDSSQVDSLNGDEVLVILQTAAMLHIESLQCTCEDLLVKRWLTPDTCLQTAATADQLSLPKLHQKASALALWNFTKVRHTEAFLALKPEALEQYIEQDAVSASEGEFEVFEALSSWIEHELEERQEHTLQLLTCVRMRDVSASDVRSMLSYTCIATHTIAKQLVNCIFLLKNGIEPTVMSEDKCMETQITSSPNEAIPGGCCDTLKRLRDHIKKHEGRTSTSEVELSLPFESEDIHDGSVDSLKGRGEYIQEIITLANEVLIKPGRQIPLVACVIGHSVSRNHGSPVKDDDPDCGEAKKSKLIKSKFGTPYLFYWDGEKTNRPVPFLHMNKIDQGPVEAVGYTVVSKGQDLFVTGGEYLLGYGDWNKSVWNYNMWNGSWSFETSLPSPRRHHSVVCLNDNLYVIGGCGRYRVIMESVDRYCLLSKTWYKCAPLPIALYAAAACVHEGLIFVISSQVICYQPLTNTWLTFSEISLPSGSSFSTAMSHNNYIYLTGMYSSDLMRFDPHGEKQVTKVGSFHNTASNACLVQDKIYVFSTDIDENACVEMFEITKNTFNIVWQGSKTDKISFKKSGGCFPIVLY